ncbi:hypothetical protein [Micromonospora profundi]|uniref:hypothetical protein n=1 Tax=Micromonospora profundi TaxID=1420889 RepID=UPI0036624DA0
MPADLMPEPPDRALVGLFDPSGQEVPEVFERDNSDLASPDDGAHWFGPDGEAHTWPEVLHTAELGAQRRRQVVRLYRADDPAITVREVAR